MERIASLLTSRYSVLLAANALITSRISALNISVPPRAFSDDPVVRKPPSLAVSLILRLPVLIILVRAFMSPETLANYTHVFLLQNLSWIVHFFHTTLAWGSIRLAPELLDAYYDPASPNLGEFAISYFFAASYTKIYLDEVVKIHMMHLIVLNGLACAGLLHRYRLVPSVFLFLGNLQTIFGVANIGHFVWRCYLTDRAASTNEYPLMVYLVRLPEFSLLSIVLIVATLHLLAFLLSPTYPPSNSWCPPIRLEQDFSYALLQFAKQSLAVSHIIGLDIERDPIILHRGRLATSTSPFSRNINSRAETEARKRARRNASYRANGIIRLWLTILGIAKQWTWYILSWIGSQRSPKLDNPWIPGENAHEDASPEDFDEGDEDFVPSCISDSVNVVDTDATDDDDIDDDASSEASSLNHEIFDLAQEILSSAAVEDEKAAATDAKSDTVSSPTRHTFQESLDFFRNLQAEPPGMLTRSRRKRYWSPSGTPMRENVVRRQSDELVEGSQSVRSVCVCCRTMARSIVLHPCGCLCLCDECRKDMAQRRYDACPCCRREIESFSRFFEP
ncbi:MAG: hypothetical protein SGCHY_003706 [Lobulomycetales sp.]